MSYDNNNIFAKILRGEVPCDKIYEDELMGFHPIFANQLKDLILEQKSKKQVVNDTPHYSKDFTTSKSRIDNPNKSPRLQINLDSLRVDSSSTSESEDFIERFCEECQEKHYFHFRKCDVCDEEHDGCCS